MVFIEQILDLDCSQEELYYLKMEALWILTIFSSHAQDDEMKLVFLSGFSLPAESEAPASPKEAQG